MRTSTEESEINVQTKPTWPRVSTQLCYDTALYKVESPVIT